MFVYTILYTGEGTIILETDYRVRLDFYDGVERASTEKGNDRLFYLNFGSNVRLPKAQADKQSARD